MVCIYVDYTFRFHGNREMQMSKITKKKVFQMITLYIFKVKTRDYRKKFNVKLMINNNR